MGELQTANEAEPAPWLDQLHQRYLQARAVSRDVAQGRGYRSIRARSEIPFGFSRDKSSPVAKQINGADGHHALAIPLHCVGVDGPLIHQMRLDYPRADAKRLNRFIKFEQPPKSKRGNEPGDIPADVHPLRHEAAESSDMPLIVTEGVVKADAILSADIREGIGVVPVALTGVTMGYTSSVRDDGTIHREITECLTRIPLPGRDVYLAWDADWATNPAVRDSLARLGKMFAELEAVVHYIYVPVVNGDPKTGVDDYLADGGSLADLMSKHLGDQPTPPDDGVTSHRALFEVDPDRLEFRPCESRYVADSTKTTPLLECKWGAIEQIIGATSVRTVLPDNTIGTVGDSFQLDVRWRRRSDGAVMQTPTPIDVPADELENVRKWLQRTHQTATIYTSPYATDERTIAATIVEHSGQYPETVRIDSTGWVKDGSGWGYLHSAGRIGASGDSISARSETDSPARHLTLPPSVADTAVAVRPWWQSWVAGDIAEGVYSNAGGEANRVGFDLAVALRMGAVIAARSILPGGSLKSAVFVFGPPGGGKTLLARAWAAPFGPHFGQQPYTNFSSTSAGVEVAVAPARNMPVVVDDFRLGTPKEQASMTAIVDGMVRSAHDGAERMRSTRDLGSMVTPVNQALLVFTGETIPTAAASTNSLASRLLLYQVPPASASTPGVLDALAGLTRDPDSAPDAIAAMVRWLANRLESCDDGETTTAAVNALRSSIAGRVPAIMDYALEVARSRCPDRPNDRTTEAAKDLALGAAMLVELAVEFGFSEEADAIRLVAEPIGWMLADTAQTVFDTEPGHLILEAVRSAIAVGHSCIVGSKGAPPPNATQWGWRQEEHRIEPARHMIGWLVDDGVGPPYVALDPQAMKAALNDFRSAAGTMSPADMAKALSAYVSPGLGPILARQTPLGTRRFTVEIDGTTHSVVPVTTEALGRKIQAATATVGNVIPIMNQRSEYGT